jgi:hypothetical protein
VRGAAKPTAYDVKVIVEKFLVVSADVQNNAQSVGWIDPADQARSVIEFLSVIYAEQLTSILQISPTISGAISEGEKKTMIK